MNLKRGRGIKSCYAMLGFLVFLTFLPVPVLSQVPPEGKGCEGSTVDILGPGVAKKYRVFLSNLKVAVGKREKAMVASMISYPLLVIYKDRKTHIQSKATLLRSYNTIFTAHVRQAIAQQTDKCLFGNQMGAMVGRGEVWFTELTNGTVKIITVNPTAGQYGK